MPSNKKSTAPAELEVETKDQPTSPPPDAPVPVAASATSPPEAQTQAVGTIDQTSKRQTLARTAITAATELMRYLEMGSDAAYEYVATGLQFEDTDFQGVGGLSHVDAAMMTNALSNFATIKQTFQTNNWDDVLLGLKP